MTEATAAQLRSASWPHLRVFKLRSDSLGPTFTENILRRLLGQLPMLQGFICSPGLLNRAGVVALTQINLLKLRALHVEPESDAMPDFMKGNWPHLKCLSLGRGLRNEDLQHLVTCPWSSLEQLELHGCSMTRTGMAHLTHAHLPMLKSLSFVNVSMLDSGRELRILAQGIWPQLLKLEIRHVPIIEERFQELALGDWPRLRVLTIENRFIFHDIMPYFVTASWPDLACLTVCGTHHAWDAASSIHLCMQKWPALQLLTLGPRIPRHSTDIVEMAKDKWPLLTVHVRDPRPK